eukprot:scaffold30415_cov124-Isochrysis_galbana.AAC.14
MTPCMSRRLSTALRRASVRASSTARWHSASADSLSCSMLRAGCVSIGRLPVLVVVLRAG